MTDTAIQVTGLGKRYFIGARQERRDRLGELIVQSFTSPFRKAAGLLRGHASAAASLDESFWALREIDFEVGRGEIMGIVGTNGAGKSTLLKVLSRITEPTEGRAEIRGRVGSLLEVGTGFHPELTGRENTYLSGAILGMRRSEIDRKFDEIVAFSEIERFIDTPVKHYSSGMYTRLAFSVAAHLDPEILLIDEVLAVGDSAFQRKCLGRMDSVARGGRTVLFVSHNMSAIRSLCGSAILLEKGRLVRKAPAEDIVDEYLRSALGTDVRASLEFERPRGASTWMESVRLLCDGTLSGQYEMGGDLTIEVDFASDAPTMTPRLGYVLFREDGTRILHANNRFQKSADLESARRRGSLRCRLGPVPLAGGRYMISLWYGNQAKDEHIVEHALSFEVIERDLWGTGKVPQRKTAPMWWPTEFTAVPNPAAEDLR